MARAGRVLVAAALVSWPLAAAGEKLEGYAEWRVGGCLVVDAQRVCPAPGLRFKAHDEARSFGAIPLGYEVRAEGERAPDGAFVAHTVDARRNGEALFEDDLRHEFDALEELYRERGRVFDLDEHGRVTEDHGRLREHGREVRRVRRILDDLVPPYLDPGDFRVYVVDNRDWNAMAAPNGALFVFSGLLEAMDDDELALIVGHELAHATHEHARRQAKKNMWIQLATAGAVAVADAKIDNGVARVATQLAALLGGLAWSNGYGRSLEDQADRVGLRYAHAAGYDVSKAPRVWRRFAERYGSLPGVVHFFVDEHSRSGERARKLERQIAWNYESAPGEAAALATRSARRVEGEAGDHDADDTPADLARADAAGASDEADDTDDADAHAAPAVGRAAYRPR